MNHGRHLRLINLKPILKDISNFKLRFHQHEILWSIEALGLILTKNLTPKRNVIGDWAWVFSNIVYLRALMLVTVACKVLDID